MMASFETEGVNVLLEQSTDLFNLLRRSDLTSALRDLRYDWDRNEFQPSSPIRQFLLHRGFVEEKGHNRLNRAGRLFLSRLLLHFNHSLVETENELNQKYKDFALI